MAHPLLSSYGLNGRRSPLSPLPRWLGRTRNSGRTRTMRRSTRRPTGPYRLAHHRDNGFTDGSACATTRGPDRKRRVAIAPVVVGAGEASMCMAMAAPVFGPWADRGVRRDARGCVRQLRKAQLARCCATHFGLFGAVMAATIPGGPPSPLAEGGAVWWWAGGSVIGGGSSTCCWGSRRAVSMAAEEAERGIPARAFRGSGDGSTDDPRRLREAWGRVVSANVDGEPRRSRFGTDWKRGLRGAALHRRLHHDAWPLHRRLHRGERSLGVAAVACREREPVGRQQRTLVHWCGRQASVRRRALVLVEG